MRVYFCLFLEEGFVKLEFMSLCYRPAGPPPTRQRAANPGRPWLTEEAWAELQYVSGTLPAFTGFAADLARAPPRPRCLGFDFNLFLIGLAIPLHESGSRLVAMVKKLFQKICIRTLLLRMSRKAFLFWCIIEMEYLFFIPVGALRALSHGRGGGRRKFAQ